MKAVLISIKPKWCELIASGKKTVEVRKTRPKLETPFKVYIYCTKAKVGKSHQYDAFGVTGKPVECGGKVVAEFVCDCVECFTTDYRMDREQTERISRLSCVDMCDMAEYEYNSPCLYGWHISDLQIYEKPKPLSEFRRPCDNDLYCEECGMYSENLNRCGNGALQLTRPPQSWGYVEELK
jgi:predicted transcriptional regulator